MRSGFLLFFGIFFSVYGLVNLYIGLHGRHFLRAAGIPTDPRLYWPLFWLVALSYILSRFLNGHVPDPLYRPLHAAGVYWLAAMVYFFLILLAVDLVRLADRLFGFLPSGAAAARFALGTGSAIILVVAGLLVYGALNARRPVVTRYEISIDKELKGRGELLVALASDIHLGALVNGRMLSRLVDEINALEPDVILLAGDILDEDLGPFVERNMDADLGRLRAPLGVYAVPGNHEYIGGSLDEFTGHLRAAGIDMLKDRVVTPAGSFHIAGRDDRSAERFTGRKRMSLTELTSGLDPALPLLVMDHQPYGLDEAAAAGADLQVSGHTHRGQFWPNSIVTGLVYELDYGLLKKGGTHFVVSSGYGTWGPPVRIGTRPEIVLIRVSGTSASARPTGR